MRLLIQHKSSYRYPRPAHLGPHTLRLRPTAHAKAKVETYRLHLTPEHTLRWQQDPYGNHVAKVHFANTPTSSLEILVELTVDVRPVNPFDFLLDELAETVPFTYPAELSRELAPFLHLDDPAYDHGPLFYAFDQDLPTTGPTVALIAELNRRVNQRVRYVIREEAGVYTPEECLARGHASCRDSAVLLTAILRKRGLAARFASGYLVQLTDEGMLPDQPKGVSRDVIDLHAWCEVYLPGAGWIGLDATSGLMAGEGHIPLCSASTPALASPLEGTCDTAADDVGFSMVVGRLGHEARPTTPYTEEVWQALTATGDQVDRHLASHHITLTMGGEPTFNARDHLDAPEWTTAALGPTKLAYGRRLVDELKRRLAPGAAVLYRPGKWYPGEPLPRWALDIIARRESPGADPDLTTPLWPDHDRPDRPLRPASSDADAERFAKTLAQTLGLEAGLTPAFEDPFFAIRDEAALPADLDPAKLPKDKLTDTDERLRIARLLSRGLDNPTGWVLPITPVHDGWATDRWQFRRGALYLIPGDSPVGLRLPLSSLSVGLPLPPVDEPSGYPPDPRRGPEHTSDATHAQAAIAAQSPTPQRVLHGVRTALCLEFRDNQLYAFLPPLPSFAHFCSLLSCLDATRAVTGLDVQLEGYGPPSSPELFRFSVTPDPGVLEVNIPPSSNLRDYDTLIQHVFDAALHAGLHAEKYLVDGRMAGSGGGNHLTFGGTSPLASPFIQRPDLLASLLTFFQHHPSLSYMFSGLFVGPTSQAPRVDEARHETLYELEIALERAFSRHLDPPEGPPPWLSDMLFRHLLVDMTGNTHRAEISIDKLFDPQTSYGRQGLVELRAFEMPPHPRMVTAQTLLVRALIATFVEHPYHHPLIRWGQSLHDRFLLPHHLWRDFEDVLAYLSDHGFHLPSDAYRPFLELRCPLVGRLQAGDITLEVRNALEPWHVLGEEQTQTGTSRYVDSSLERIEVRALNLTPGRHLVLVNGYTLPLQPTPESHIHLGGVRFRAWAPPHSLHAHIGIHHPIRLEVVDTWSQRSLGGCSYHVWHPEGRAFDLPPLTRFEAAARRAQRFTVDAHTPWPVLPKPARPHPDQPCTLDLRRLPLDRPMPRPESAS